MNKTIVAVLFWICCFHVLQSQIEINNEERPWYSLYVYKKINHRWSMDFYQLVAMRSLQQDLWLTQTGVGVNYKINRFYTASIGYGNAKYPYSGSWWDRHYPDSEPGLFNTITFQTLSLGLRRTDDLSPQFRLSNKLIYSQFFPKFEKYQSRIQYLAKLSYRNKSLPLKLRPYVQGALYYYLNGVKTMYYREEAGEWLELGERSPDGLHRARLKLGFQFRPFRRIKRLHINLYAGYNFEFNGIGNDLNFERPRRSGNGTSIVYPFNNYKIYGLQLNLFL